MVVVFLVFIGLPIQMAKAAECQEVIGIGQLCLTVEGGQAVVSGPLGIGLSVDVPETRIEVPVPGPVVTVPAPAPTTIFIPRPTTQTATRTAPGATATVTQTPSPSTVTTTITPRPTRTTSPARQTDDQDAKIVPDAAPNGPKTNTIITNAAIGVGFVLLGIALAIALMFLAYRQGKAGAERSFNAFVQDLTDLTMTRRR